MERNDFVDISTNNSEDDDVESGNGQKSIDETNLHANNDGAEENNETTMIRESRSQYSDAIQHLCRAVKKRRIIHDIIFFEDPAGIYRRIKLRTVWTDEAEPTSSLCLNTKTTSTSSMIAHTPTISYLDLPS